LRPSNPRDAFRSTGQSRCLSPSTGQIRCFRGIPPVEQTDLKGIAFKRPNWPAMLLENGQISLKSVPNDIRAAFHAAARNPAG
jgi:hypothetical protein